jgi:hypothetical protein
MPLSRRWTVCKRDLSRNRKRKELPMPEEKTTVSMMTVLVAMRS